MTHREMAGLKVFRERLGQEYGLVSIDELARKRAKTRLLGWELQGELKTDYAILRSIVRKLVENEGLICNIF
jgi:hypothetical protein